MEPNYGRGKTGALFQLRGPNRESLREALYGGEVSLTSVKYGFTFHIERHYKHMGVVVSFDCSWRPEITRRIQSCEQAMGPIRRGIIPRKNIKDEFKV
eukprot:301630-Pyramimonas_sp.AAC.1